MGYLIDTCIWIDVEQGVLSPADVAEVTGDAPVYLSPVTIAELKFGAMSVQEPGIRQLRLAALERLKRKPLLVIDGVTGDLFGDLVAYLKAQGKGHRYRIQDVWLAASAIQHNCTLLTHNAKDFTDLPGLEIAGVRAG